MFKGAEWYQDLERALAGSDALVKLILIGVIAGAVFLILQPSRTLRAAAALWFLLP